MTARPHPAVPALVLSVLAALGLAACTLDPSSGTPPASAPGPSASTSAPPADPTGAATVQGGGAATSDAGDGTDTDGTDGIEAVPDGETSPVLPTVNRATRVVDLDPFEEDGTPQSGYVVKDVGGRALDCSDDLPAYGAITAETHRCGSTGDGAYACWAPPTYPGRLLCLGHPWSTVLRSYPATGIGHTPVIRDPAPLAVELTDGSRYLIRTGGAWPERDDGYDGAYSCAAGPCLDEDHADTAYVVVAPDEPTVDTTGDVWTVRLGALGEQGQTFPAPTTGEVSRAWFVASHF